MTAARASAVADAPSPSEPTAHTSSWATGATTTAASRMQRGEGRQPAGRPAQAPRHDGLAARQRLRVAPAAAHELLEHDERERERHQHGGELQRGRLVEGAVPDAVDRVGEGAVVEQVDRAEVGQRLHHRERHAAGQRRPGERQRHPPHGGGVGEAERAGRLERLPRLAQERAAGEHVDVRVQHERQHRDRPARRAQLRQRQPERGVVVLAEQHEHEHVGGHRHRQHQRPVEPAAAREVVERDERRQRAAEQERADADPRRQHQARPQRVRQQARRDLVERLALAEERRRQHQQRRGDQRRDRDPGDGPA